jgi:hypothetical protein
VDEPSLLAAALTNGTLDFGPAATFHSAGDTVRAPRGG